MISPAETIREIKTAMRPAEGILKIRGICTIMNGTTDMAMIFAAWLVGKSTKTPEPANIGQQLINQEEPIQDCMDC